ncbi:MAG: hypothetical protein Q8L57_02825, partial [bacterium]|nr:hypothetical protein [bacterium]
MAPGLIIGQNHNDRDDSNSPSPPPPINQETKPAPVVIAPKHPPVEILATADRIKFVGGQNIVLKTEVVFYQQINPFWEEIAKIDFSPFRVEKVILGERKIFDKEKDLARDFREITFLLSLPISSGCGSYSIPSFSLNYSYFNKEKKEFRGATKSKAIQVEKVPILVTFEIDKDVVTIGEVNTFRLTIWREKFIRILNQELKNQNGQAPNLEKEGFQRWLKSLEVRNQKITNFNKPDFPNFKILAKDFRIEVQDQIVKEKLEYRFAFYELGGKEFKTPSFHIWYLDGSQEEKIQKPKEIIVPPLAVQVNLVVRKARQSLEELKSPKPSQKNNLYYFGYGPLAFGGIFILIFTISALIKYLR